MTYQYKRLSKFNQIKVSEIFVGGMYKDFKKDNSKIIFSTYLK